MLNDISTLCGMRILTELERLYIHNIPEPGLQVRNRGCISSKSKGNVLLMECTCLIYASYITYMY